MRHRGPNDAGYHVDDRVAIGVRRLSIIDVVDGHQPFANERGNVVAAQNGELYNHEAIRRRLERDGHVFTSRCDTEILPHLYEAEDGDMRSPAGRRTRSSTRPFWLPSGSSPASVARR